MRKKKILMMLAMLLMTAVGARAQTTYTVTVKDGTEDAANWSATPNPAGEGQGVTIKYNGKKKVKIVTAVQKTLRPLAEATTADLGKIAGADGNIYNTKAAAEAAYTQAVAMIAYVDTENNNGLAIALSDEDNIMDWSTAKSTCEAKNTSTCVANASWMLPSKEQWNAMLNANGGYTGLQTALATAGGDSSKLPEDCYWSSTEYYSDAWDYDFYFVEWHWDGRDEYFRVRACLAFAVEQAVAPETPTHKYVDLGLSVKWATCNVGAEKPEEYGDYFAWGETAAKSNNSWSTYKFTTDGGKTFTKYTGSDKTVLDATDDAATVNWGIAWRMPTLEEMKELLNNENCTWEWQAAGNTTFGGVAGYKVTSKKAGYTDKYIFLPAVGYRLGTVVDDAGSLGYYWSSSLYADDPRSAYGLYYFSEYKVWNYYDRFYGFTVRPVLKN